MAELHALVGDHGPTGRQASGVEVVGTDPRAVPELEVDELLTDAYRLVAPTSLRRQLAD